MSIISTPPARPGGAIGAEPGRTHVGAAAVRELGTGSAVLPEIIETPKRQRPWWLHPAFVVSIILTFLTIVAAVVWWILAMINDDSVRVSDLSIGIESGNVALHWSGPDAEYALYEVSADGDVTDLTQLVRGTSAWIHSAAGLYDDGSCFVVRPGGMDGEVTLDADALQGQRGAAACVSAAR